MDWRSLTISDLESKGFMYETTTDGWWILVGLGFITMLAIAVYERLYK